MKVINTSVDTQVLMSMLVVATFYNQQPAPELRSVSCLHTILHLLTYTKIFRSLVEQWAAGFASVHGRPILHRFQVMADYSSNFR